jgi:hypothetical protein
MLDGVDKEWQDAGTRQQAFYTGLPPGRFRFHVTACNNDGVWNEDGAVLDFNIAPAFYQTRWVLGLCILIAMALLYLLYQMRLGEAATVRATIEARLGERSASRGNCMIPCRIFTRSCSDFKKFYNLLPTRPEEAQKTLGRYRSAAQAMRAGMPYKTYAHLPR